MIIPFLSRFDCYKFVDLLDDFSIKRLVLRFEIPTTILTEFESMASCSQTVELNFF